MVKNKEPVVVDIAHLSFSIDTIEEVALQKIFESIPYRDKPDAYSVSWSEWIGDNSIVAKKEEQTYKVKKVQRFDTYAKARIFFVDKVNSISSKYKEEIWK
ncbi:MAG: hypothetical protein ACW99A_13380 [Candidatus Kariarchaeaceae archaeon]|jgi:hypothetical protein